MAWSYSWGSWDGIILYRQRSKWESVWSFIEHITGRAGGGPFEVYASTIEKLQEPKRGGVEFQTKDLKSRLSVFDNRGDRRRQRGQSQNIIAEAWLKPIKNPVTGQVHRAIIEIPEAFESSRMEQASTKKLVANDNYLGFRYKEHMGVSLKIGGKDLRYKMILWRIQMKVKMGR